jgi:hypothetical protein
MTGGPDLTPELQGRLKYEMYREMREDPACRSLLWLWKLPIRSAEWAITPSKKDPDGDAIAQARADFASEQVGLGTHDGWMNLSWDEWLQQTLLCLDYGSMGEEIIWAEPKIWTDADGDEHLVRSIAQMAPRFPYTVDTIETDNETGWIGRVRQDLPGADWIPGRKLAWYVLDREGKNWWGRSMLRAAYGPWYLKKSLSVAAAIGWDRFAAGLPIVTHPPGMEQKAKDIGRNMRVHERAWIAIQDDPQTPRWKIDLLSGNGTLMDPTPLLRFYNGEIAIAGLQQFSSLGTTERGSRAVGEVLADPYYLAVQSLAKYIAAERMKRFLRRLFDVNFGPGVPVPEVVVSKIEGRNVSGLARTLADLATAGLSFTDRDTQNDIRDRLDLRHLPDLPADVGIAPAPTEGGSIQVNPGDA